MPKYQLKTNGWYIALGTQGDGNALAFYGNGDMDIGYVLGKNPETGEYLSPEIADLDKIINHTQEPSPNYSSIYNVEGKILYIYDEFGDLALTCSISEDGTKLTSDSGEVFTFIADSQIFY